MPGVLDHRSLDAWKLAEELRVRIRSVTVRPAFQHHAWLRDQLRRAANSGCTNTAEGFSRYWPRDFARFLDIARGSMTEILEHMPDVAGLGLVTPTEADEICSYARRARAAMAGLTRYLRSAQNPRSLRREKGGKR